MRSVGVKIWRPIAVIVLLLLAGNSKLFGQAITHESQLKAAFLFNFTQFVEWPSASFEGPEAPVVIGVLGDNRFEGYLDELVAGQKVGGRPVTVTYYQTADEIKNCHILFIHTADTTATRSVIASWGGKPMLTVSDAPGFLHDGGMVRLFTKDNKIKIEINLEAAKAADLVISSKLLRLSEIFTTN